MQFTARRMIVVAVVIAVVLTTIAWVIKLTNDINQNLHDFYGPEGTKKRVQEYQGEVNSVPLRRSGLAGRTTCGPALPARRDQV